jgi:[CysO sulfur-carrier protein]-S-L-cysteine hydrolase
LRIPRQLVDEIVAHARAEAPNECCGMIAAREGRAVAVHRTRNIHASPLRFEMEPGEQLRVLDEIEQAGLELGAIYHSHTRSEPYPSLTDVNLARWWPEPLWVIVGLAGAEPDVRAFRIVDGAVTPAALEIEDRERVDA